MSASSVITLGYGQSVNLIPVLGYGAGAIIPTPTPTPTRDQGAGAGRKKKFGEITLDDRAKLEAYRKIGEEIARSREVKEQVVTEPIKARKAPEFKPRLLKQPKIGDISEIKLELQKLKFDVSEEILLQTGEDEAIFMLMMAALT